MPDEKPSYKTSTTSRIFLITAVGYVSIATLIAGIGAWKGQAGYLDAARQSMESLLTFVGLLYGVRKGGEMVKEANGNKHEPPSPT